MSTTQQPAAQVETATFSMRGFGEHGRNNRAVYQPGEFIDVSITNGVIAVEVDCYCFLRQGSEYEFDPDQWENEKYVFMKPADCPARMFWYEAFRLARALLSGYAIQLGEENITLNEWVADQRTAPVVKIGAPDGLVGEEEIAAALGCTVEYVRLRAIREGWAYWLDNGDGKPMTHVTPAKAS